MNFIDKTLRTLEECISTKTYVEVETERFELKVLHESQNWTELYKTVCAFLNTNGGIIIIGIKDKHNDKNYYEFKGFNYDNEAKLKEIETKFTDSQGRKLLNLTPYFPSVEIRDFHDGKIALIYVEKLPEDEKFAYFEGKAYKRKLTGDHVIPKTEIDAQVDLKQELINAQELSIVENASLELLNIDKLNQYIIRLNRGKTVETLKADLEKALPFLNRKAFVRDNRPTLLGMLVCGDYVEDYIGGKCEMDCYVDSPIVVAQNKQVLKENIISLMEESIGFVYKNIQVGVSRKNGGTALPEYPEALLEETINNALAHRDYRSNRFCIIEIKPNESIMIRNPGAFRPKQIINLDTEKGKIRRIIPIQVARNPKLTDLLKSFDRWEGKGKGLASLTDACLENTIDLPYYTLMTDEIKLFIPKGKIYDDAMEIWLNSFSGFILGIYGKSLSEEEKVILSYFYKSERKNRLDHYTVLLTSDNNHKNIIADLEEKELLFKNPQSPPLYPVYLVNRTLVKNDFTKEIEEVLGNEFLLLPSDYRKVVSAIFQHNEFADNRMLISANSIGSFLYLQENIIIDDLKHYEIYKRKIRNIFNQLENKKIILRKDGKSKEEGGKPDFKINTDFKIDRKNDNNASLIYFM
jgi:ATP-dependent DNA helicase RecG